MSLSSIQQMFPIDLSEEAVQQIYTNFVCRYRAAYLRRVEQLEQLSEPVLDPQNQESTQVESLVLTTAVAATLYKLVTDKPLALQLPKRSPPTEPLPLNMDSRRWRFLTRQRLLPVFRELYILNFHVAKADLALQVNGCLGIGVRRPETSMPPPVRSRFTSTR